MKTKQPEVKTTKSWHREMAKDNKKTMTKQTKQPEDMKQIKKKGEI